MKRIIPYGFYGMKEFRMKKIKIILVCVLFIFLQGCNDVNVESATPNELAKQQSEAIIEAVVNEDKEALKEMFCQHIKDTHDLDEELRQFFRHIHGEIVSYDEPDGSQGFMSTTETGIAILRLKGNIENIKTDAGKSYRVAFNSYDTYVKNEDYVGLSFISIREDAYDEDLGYLDEGAWVGGVIED